MPPWITQRAAPAVWRRIPWKMVWAASLWLAQKGQERIDRNLTKEERGEFLGLLARSRGRPSNLGAGDRARIRSIAGKALRG